MNWPPYELHADIFLAFASLWAVYMYAWRRHTQAGAVEADRRKRVTLFTFGVATLLAATVWPLHELSDGKLYGAHMVQHMLYQLAAAPLLLTGTPAWMWRAILRPRWVMSTWRAVTRPVFALLLFDGVLLVSHWPAFSTAVVASEPLHLALHVVLVVSAVIMWWPVFSPLPEAPAVAPPLQMMYLFVVWILPMLPATFMEFASHPMYTAYDPSSIVPGLSMVSDQRVAGLLMNVGGTMILWGFITYIFFHWYSEEQRSGWDALEHQGLERDVRAGMSGS